MFGDVSQDPNRPIAVEIAKASRTGDIELLQNILDRNRSIKGRLLESVISAAVDAEQVHILE